MMQGGRGGGGVHATVQRCQGDQKQAEQVKTSRSGLSVFNQLSILYFLLLVLLQHSISFVFLLSVFFAFPQAGNLWDGRGRNCGVGKADAGNPFRNKVVSKSDPQNNEMRCKT